MNSIFFHIIITLALCFVFLQKGQSQTSSYTYDIDNISFLSDSIELEISLYNQPIQTTIRQLPRIDISVIFKEGKNIELNNNNFYQIRNNNNTGISNFKAKVAYHDIFPVPTKSRLNLTGFTVKRNNSPIDFNNHFNIKEKLLLINENLDDYIFKSSIRNIFCNNIDNEIRNGINNPSVSTQKEITQKYIANNSDFFKDLSPDVQANTIEQIVQEFRDLILSQIDSDSLYTPIIVKKLLELYPQYSLDLLFKGINKRETISDATEIKEIELLVKSLGKYCTQYPEEVLTNLVYNLNDTIKEKLAENYYLNDIKRIQALLAKIDTTELLRYTLAKNYYLKNKNQINELINGLNVKEYNRYILPDLISIADSSFDNQRAQKRGINNYPMNPNPQQIIKEVQLRNDTLQPITYNFINANSNPQSFKSKISPYKKNEINMGIGVELNVDSLSNKLSHHINYFNMDKYYGVGLTLYKRFYINQFCFNFQTRIDDDYMVQPLVFGNIETYWTNGVNGDFGIALNKFQKKGFFNRFNIGIYTGAEYINQKEFLRDALYNSYYNWEVGLSISKSFQKDIKDSSYLSLNLRIPSCYRSTMGNNVGSLKQNCFSPQITASYFLGKFNFQLGGQIHLSADKLPVSNVGIWLKAYYKLNRY